MKIRHRILQFSNSPKFRILQIELDKLGEKYKIENLGGEKGKDLFSIEYIISENDPIYPKIAILIEKYNFMDQVGVHYNEEEINNAEWLWATAGEFQYPQPEDDYKEATYALSDYCPRCGIGAIQINPFRLKHSFRQKNSQFLGLHWVFDEIFVRPKIKTLFEKEGFTGIEYSYPMHYKSELPIENIFQMIITTIAEPGLATQELSPVTCKENNEESYFKGLGKRKDQLKGTPYCGRIKYHLPRRTTIKFQKEIFNDMPEIVKSYEYFGSGAGAFKLILMQREVMDFIKSHNLRGLKFTPIELV